jgi:hypothetical protein
VQKRCESINRNHDRFMVWGSWCHAFHIGFHIMAVGQVPARPVHPRPSRSNTALKGQFFKFSAEMCWGCFHVDNRAEQSPEDHAWSLSWDLRGRGSDAGIQSSHWGGAGCLTPLKRVEPGENKKGFEQCLGKPSEYVWTTIVGPSWVTSYKCPASLLIAVACCDLVHRMHPSARKA